MEELPNDVIRTALTGIINKIVKTEDYTVQIEAGSSKGDNYIGIIYRVKVEKCYKNNSLKSNHGESENNQISIILKLPPQNPIRRKQFFARNTFLRESLLYDELLPLFFEFQKSKGVVSNENGFFQIPKCLGTITDDEYEAIFLEDLMPKGFQMFNRFDKITIEHVELIVRTLAKFHAVSFAIKDQNPEKIAQYKTLQDIFQERQDDEQLLAYFESLRTRALDTLDTKTDQLIIDKLKKTFEDTNYMKLLLSLASGAAAEPYAVICHGDVWNNNILFKYQNGKPIDISLIDWQITRYASPVTDLMYYLFSCTTREFRSVHYLNLMNMYHEQLSTTLKYLGSDSAKLFPRKALDDQLKKFGSWGFHMSMMLLPIITSYAEDIPDLDELSEKLEGGTVDVMNTFKPKQTFDVYQERMRGVILDMYNFGYI